MKSKCELYAVCISRASLKPYRKAECPIVALGNTLLCLHYTRKLPCGHQWAYLHVSEHMGEKIEWCAKCEEEQAAQIPLVGEETENDAR